MAFDDEAGRSAVRGWRVPGVDRESESVFVSLPRHSPRSMTPRIVMREDVHQRGLTAARKALRSVQLGKVAARS